MSKKETESMANQDTDSTVNRRELLLGLSAAATAAASMAYAGAAPAAMKDDHDHSKHDHSKHSTQLPDLLDAVNNCHDKGERCIAHCMVSFTEGSTELADCASKAQEMLAVCGGFSYLVASNSSYIKDYARVCETVCNDCAKECRKHDKHHECKACAEACEDLVDSIKLRVS